MASPQAKENSPASATDVEKQAIRKPIAGWRTPIRPNGRNGGKIKDIVSFGEATVSHLPSTQMPVDGLTKGLDREKHNLFLCYLGLQ